MSNGADAIDEVRLTNPGERVLVTPTKDYRGHTKPPFYATLLEVFGGGTFAYVLDDDGVVHECLHRILTLA